MTAREVVWVTIDSAACVSAAFSKFEAPFLSLNPLPGTVRGHYWHMAPGAASGLVRLCGARRVAAAHPPPRYVQGWGRRGPGRVKGYTLVVAVYGHPIAYTSVTARAH
jgi:hypothetical protein